MTLIQLKFKPKHPPNMNNQVTYLKFNINIRKRSNFPKHMAHQPIRFGPWLFPTPMSPPGTANCSSFFSAHKESILVYIGMHLMSPFFSLKTIPRQISIVWCNLKTPYKQLELINGSIRDMFYLLQVRQVNQ